MDTCLQLSFSPLWNKTRRAKTLIHTIKYSIFYKFVFLSKSCISIDQDHYLVMTEVCLPTSKKLVEL